MTKIRLYAFGAAVCLAVALSGALEAQEPQPCPDGGDIRFAVGGVGGCGPEEPALDLGGMVPALMDPMSDLDINLRYRVEEDGTVRGSGEVPAGSEAVLISLDHARGTYRTFDLGSLYADSMTQPNTDRIHRWMQTDLDSDAPPEAVLAYLAEVDSLKLETRASLLRARYLPARSNVTTDIEIEETDPEPQPQQQDCEQWAVMTLQTSDIVMIPMVRTKNDTRVSFRNGRRYMRILVSCWATNPSRIGTTWHTQSCRGTPTFYRTRARSRVYQAAYNDDFFFGAGGRHWIRHWIWAHFDHLRNVQGTTFDFRYSGPSGGTFMTAILGRHDQSTCR